ncbi:putative glutamate carboxypeptidase [Helianthus annuus]|nr:putative glutamate carboxypeptidase [Helianthus annuus]
MVSLCGQISFRMLKKEFWMLFRLMFSGMGMNHNLVKQYDLVKFINLIKEAGLYVHLRIGPYACVEWNFGYNKLCLMNWQILKCVIHIEIKLCWWLRESDPIPYLIPDKLFLEVFGWFSTFEGVVFVENGHIGENESGPHVSESVCVEKAPGPSFPKDAVDGMLGHLELLIPTAALLPCLRFEKLWKGWKPRRTIIFCNWDAEEYGLIGSTEWVEENREMLASKVVAYLNVDIAVAGAGFQASATPQLDQLITEVIKQVNTCGSF